LLILSQKPFNLPPLFSLVADDPPFAENRSEPEVVLSPVSTLPAT
jgi:hypothetical protein